MQVADALFHSHVRTSAPVRRKNGVVPMRTQSVSERADSLEKEQTGDSPYQPSPNFISKPNTFNAFLRAVLSDLNRLRGQI